MTLDINYVGFLGIDLFKSVLMFSEGPICLNKLLFKMGLFTVYKTTKKPEKLQLFLGEPHAADLNFLPLNSRPEQ
jgi:hypothetical protein